MAATKQARGFAWVATALLAALAALELSRWAAPLPPTRCPCRWR